MKYFNDKINILETIIKSPNDDCEYKITTLKNGLKSLLISDANTTLSYVAMIVNTGSLMENKILGIAHFLEHMLFMGNKKYPDGNKYFEYVNSNGGKTNAFTDSLRTCYYFSINNKYLENIIDVFAHFFIDPLFDSDNIDNEINAVDSEYHKDKGIMGFQYRYALKLLAKETHPFKNFDIGSKDTLKCDNIRDELISFYQKYYIAQNMQLIIFNNKPINEMEKYLEFFENVSSDINDIKKLPIFGEPFENGNIIRLVPTSNTHLMLVTWSLPYENNYDNYKILKYIFYLLGRESEGSLAHILINNSLIIQLNIQTITNFGDYITIGLEMKLTDYGYSNVDIVMSIIMYYINTLRNIGFDKKNFKLYGKCTKLNFLFEEQLDINEKVMNILTNLCTFYSKLHESVSLGSLICDCDDDTISKYNNYLKLITCERANIIIGSPKCIASVKNKEKWFGFPYNIEKNNLNNTQLIFKFNDIYKFNSAYIPTQLMIYKNKEKFHKPIRLEFPYEVWYNYENTRIPKVCVIIQIKLPFMYDNIKKYLSMCVFIFSIDKKLRSVLYDAILCNTTYSLVIDRDELKIRIYGFNDKISLIVDNIIEALLNKNIDFATFTHAKNEYSATLDDIL